MQDSLPAGGLRLYREGSNPLDRFERFQVTFPFSFPGLLLSQGWSTPSRLSAGPRRCSPTSVAIPMGRDRQLPVGHLDRHRRRLPLEGLSPLRQGEGLDPRRARVHPPLSAAYLAGRLPSHPPLRLPRQWPPGGEAGTVPDAARRSAPGADDRAHRRSGLHAASRSLPLLRRRNDHSRHTAAARTVSAILLARQLMTRRHLTAPDGQRRPPCARARIVLSANTSSIERDTRIATTGPVQPPPHRRSGLPPA